MEREARENVEGATLLRDARVEFDRASEAVLIDLANRAIDLLLSFDSLNDLRAKGFTFGVRGLAMLLTRPLAFFTLSSGVRGNIKVLFSFTFAAESSDLSVETDLLGAAFNAKIDLG